MQFRRRLTERYNASAWVRLLVIAVSLGLTFGWIWTVSRFDLPTWFLTILCVSWVIFLSVVQTWLITWYPDPLIVDPWYGADDPRRLTSGWAERRKT